MVSVLFGEYRCEWWASYLGSIGVNCGRPSGEYLCGAYGNWGKTGHSGCSTRACACACRTYVVVNGRVSLVYKIRAGEEQRQGANTRLGGIGPGTPGARAAGEARAECSNAGGNTGVIHQEG
jgi:hypothetical protein